MPDLDQLAIEEMQKAHHDGRVARYAACPSLNWTARRVLGPMPDSQVIKNSIRCACCQRTPLRGCLCGRACNPQDSIYNDFPHGGGRSYE